MGIVIVLKFRLGVFCIERFSQCHLLYHIAGVYTRILLFHAIKFSSDCRNINVNIFIPYIIFFKFGWHGYDMFMQFLYMHIIKFKYVNNNSYSTVENRN
jgi:hypothetical protein